ncbi:MAG: tail fiber domain-containing protein [Pseudomonadota bacterium]
MKMTRPVFVWMIFAVSIFMVFPVSALCSESLIVNENGYVGIGTTTPGTLMHLKGLNYPALTIESINSMGGRLRLIDTVSSSEFISVDGDLRINVGSNNVLTIKSDSGNVGIGHTNPGSKLTVDGNIYCYGSYQPSDLRWKEDIETLVNPLEKISNLQGVTYQWKDKTRGEQNQIGLIAQEVETVFPELVFTNKEGYKAIEYSRLVAPLIGAVKELKSENDSLKEELSILKKRIFALEKTN